MHQQSPLIVGGGPAGAAAAIRLAERGIAPRVLERSTAPQDMLCGGFLSWSTVARLRALGVDPSALGGRRIGRVRLIAGEQQVTATLPFPAVALSRRRLDEALLARAEALGARIDRGRVARSIDDGRVRLADGEVLHADKVVLATGKHDLRGAARPPSPTGMLGLRWRLVPTPALDRLVEDMVELHLFEGGYAGLVRQEDDVNLCLAVGGERFRAHGTRPEKLLAALAEEAPALRERLDQARAIGAAQAVANIPYGWLASDAAGPAFRIGDQCAVIASLAGEGIDVALASGEAAADAIVRGTNAGRFQHDFARRVRGPIARADVLWRTMEKPRAARIAIRALGVAPGLLRTAARMTRV